MHVCVPTYLLQGSKAVAHKAFRRYTQRAKQGGSQASFDKKGKHVCSFCACLGGHLIGHRSEDHTLTHIHTHLTYTHTQHRKGKKAQSVGAQLRRQGEQKTREDVRSILGEWAELLKACDLIFLSVPKAMRWV